MNDQFQSTRGILGLDRKRCGPPRRLPGERPVAGVTRGWMRRVSRQWGASALETGLTALED